MTPQTATYIIAVATLVAGVYSSTCDESTGQYFGSTSCYESSGKCDRCGDWSDKEPLCYLENTCYDDFVIQDCERVYCQGDRSCYGAIISNFLYFATETSSEAALEATISNGQGVLCEGESACKDASISNVKNIDRCDSNGSYFCWDIECEGEEACSHVAISDFSNLLCSGGDYSCNFASISGISEDGYVDCGDVDETYSYACRAASITSDNPFTLTCAGTPGNSILACGKGHVTNPGGSVFCYGGTNSNGICQELTITDTVQCVICGHDDACEDVDIVDSSGNVVHSMKDHEVAVYSGCEAADVVDYLNKVHPDGGSTPCQDNDSDGYCDVVEAYCGRKTRDANCIDEFQVADGSWTKEKITSANDIDPDSLQSNSSTNDGDDDISKESWIVGSIVIAAFIIIMIAVIFYFGRKNQWACLKQTCGSSNHKKEEEPSQQEKTNGTNGSVSEKEGEEDQENIEHV